MLRFNRRREMLRGMGRDRAGSANRGWKGMRSRGEEAHHEGATSMSRSQKSHKSTQEGFGEG